MKSNHFKMRWLCLLFALFTLNIQAQITVVIKNKPLKEAIKQSNGRAIIASFIMWS